MESPNRLSRSLGVNLITNGKRIKELRKERGWSQKLLAKKLDMTVRNLQFLEQGKSTKKSTLDRLAEIFACPVDELTLMIQVPLADSDDGGVVVIEREVQEEQDMRVDDIDEELRTKSDPIRRKYVVQPLRRYEFVQGTLVASIFLNLFLAIAVSAILNRPCNEPKRPYSGPGPDPAGRVPNGGPGSAPPKARTSPKPGL